MSRLLLVLAVLLVGCAVLTQAAIPQHLITQLPGLSASINFKQYAGYINIGDSGVTRNMFYWFVESQRSPATDPVLLWMNGGPGGSSLIGLLTEHGPFRVNSDGKTLFLNPYAWNQVASIIYLEAPLGVGFSYSTDELDYLTDDLKTAKNNYKFLLAWFAAYPEYKPNPFYITGESYAGHYVPELANQVLDGNLAVNNDPHSPKFINVTGLLVGNPGTDDDWYYMLDQWSYITFLYTHGLLPQPNYTSCVSACGWQDFLTNCADLYINTTKECRAVVNRTLWYMPSMNNLDPYDVYAPVCLPNSTSAVARRAAAPQVSVDEITFDPCASNYMTSYLNIASVQQALHVKSMRWAEFSYKIIYANERDIMIKYYQRFFQFAPQWRILIYSGDVDSAVPFIGTQRWIECLDRPVVRDYHNWVYNEQIAGTVKDWKGISFCTIKGAGHMVPYYLPPQGYAFFERWIQGQPI